MLLVENVMDFWTKKMDVLFGVYDANHNGVLDMNDAVLITNRFADEFGWPVGGTTERNFKASFFRIWSRFIREADANHDGSVSRDEFYGYFKRVTENDAQFFKHLRPFVEDLFSILDTDQDGLLTKEDYMAFYRACNNSEEDAELAFELMDHNGDGQISHLEFYTMLYNFYMNPSPDHNSRNFFGMVG